LYGELYVLEINKDTDNEVEKNECLYKIENLVILKNTILLSIIHRTSNDKKHKNNFVFPILKNEDFIDVDDKNNFSYISKELYKKIDSRCSIYNKNLNSIQIYYEIKTKIRSHISRHTFTQLMISRGIEWYIIYKCLGHTNFNTTRVYLNSLDTSSVDKGITGVNEILEPKGGRYNDYSKYIDITKIDLPF
jgi:integrase